MGEKVETEEGEEEEGKEQGVETFEQTRETRGIDIGNFNDNCEGKAGTESILSTGSEVLSSKTEVTMGVFDIFKSNFVFKFELTLKFGFEFEFELKFEFEIKFASELEVESEFGKKQFLELVSI